MLLLQVIEKLVELNTDLMDKSNTLAFTAARQAESLQAAAAAAGAGDHPASLGPPPVVPVPPLMPAAAPLSGPGITSGPLDPTQVPPHHQHHNHNHQHHLRSQASSSSYPSPPVSYNAVAPPSVSGSHAWQQSPQQDSWRGTFDYGRGPPPPPPLMGNPHAGAPGSSPHPAWLPPAGPSHINDTPAAAGAGPSAAAAGAGEAPSLTDAFSKFLMQPDEPKPATANSLAEPSGGPASGGKPRLGGLFGTAKTLVKYVAGSEPAKEQAQAGAGQPVGNGTAQ